MTRIFVDTSALLALLDADDPRQELVRTAFADHAEDELVTHGYVVAESLAVARRRLGVDGVIALLDDVLPAFEVLPIELALHAKAQDHYRASLPTGTSFVDHVSLAFMEQTGINTAFVLDSDFEGHGLAVLPGRPSA